MSMQFDATYYMDARPDVLAAFVNSGAETGTGLTWPAFAQQHYNNFGWKEGYNPNPIFNTNEYLTANEDVLNAGVNPFEHYLTHGVNEGRAPNASFPKFADFDADAYLAANSDLGEAGIETAEEAYAHFVMHGQFENRPGAPVVDTNPGETQNLTIGVDAIVGTGNNDTFNAVPVNPATSAAATTLNAWDSIDGGDGVDTLNIYTDTGEPTGHNLEQLGTVKNVEIINVYNKTGATFAETGGIDASKFVGSQQIWQIDGATNVTALANGQTAGFRDTGGARTLTTVAAATEINVALDNAANSSTFTLTSAATASKVATASVAGSIEAGEGAGDAGPAGYKAGLTLKLNDSIKTLNLALEGDNVDLSVYNNNEGKNPASKLVTLNAADSTAGIWLDATDLLDSAGLALETISFGSGNDSLQFNTVNLTAEEVSVSLGAVRDRSWT